MGKDEADAKNSTTRIKMEEEDNLDFNDPAFKFLTIRLCEGLTQAQLTRKLKVHPLHVSHIERGLRPITEGIAQKMADTFSVEKEYFFYEKIPQRFKNSRLMCEVTITI